MTRMEFLMVLRQTFEQEVSDMKKPMTLADFGTLMLITSAVAREYRVELEKS